MIARWAAALSRSPRVAVGIGDDAAVLDNLRAPAVCCDALVEGVHFKLDWTGARDLGWKTLAVNLSDLAAMGARPVAALLSLAAPKTLGVEWLDEFYGGLDECARAFGCAVAGGDTTRSPGPLFVSACAIGEILGAPLLRSGARAGDALIATGTLGDSRGGLHLLQENIETANPAAQFLLGRHFRPTPRLREIEHVLQFRPGAVTAALDISDGLAGDAAHIARASGLSLRIESLALPLSPALREVAAREGWDSLEEALRGGEDYELLLCARAESAADICRLIEELGTRATIIGQAVAPHDPSCPQVLVRGADGTVQPAGESWTHF
jgi:thiamine-monophosphate kinase